MPKPVYIVCSQAGIEDKRTGLVSIFNVIEKIQITTKQLDPTSKQSILGIPTLRVLAVWMTTEEDKPDETFDYEMVFIIPPANKELVAVKGQFLFTKPLHRFFIDCVGLPIEGTGILRIESRIRKVSSEEWLRQSYPIFLERIPDSTA